MRLTAADRMPETGDVLRMAGADEACPPWYVEMLAGNGRFAVNRGGVGVWVNPSRLSQWHYVSRADGGPITKEGE